MNEGNPIRRLSFQDLKSKVGIEDVAYALGYRLDRRAGVGRYFELVLNEGKARTDTIVVRNTPNKAAQTFFRRNGSSGDVVTFIHENLNSFNEQGKNDWEKITRILSKFANMPVVEYREDLKQINASKGNNPFDPSRYEVKKIDLNNIPRLFANRGFDEETVRNFSPFISLICDRNNRNFNGFNIGFPYTAKCHENVVGYEIRGYTGFKSKAAGTNSSTAAWIADFSNGNSNMVRNVYFFESAFDAMAFHQMNRMRLDKDIALVSLGGTFADGQILSVIDRFPNARLIDCFDNDLAGRINAVRLMSVAEQVPISISKADSQTGVQIEAKGKSFRIELKRPIYVELGEHISLRHKLGSFLPPKNFKDWNDCLLGKQINPVLKPTKEDRNDSLAEKRKSSFKI